MAGENAAIWEVQSGAANGTEATATTTNTQLFNSTTKTPSTGAVISDIKIILAKATPQNPSVNTETNSIQDMGIKSLDVTIIGLTGDTDNSTASNFVNKMIKWQKDGNTTTGFTKGRFGLRLDNAPQWNVVPNADAGGSGADYGFHLRDLEVNYVGERKDLAEFTIQLSLGGSIVNAL